MTTSGHAGGLEDQIDQWRAYLRRRQAIHAVDVEELEGHLRDQIAALQQTGLTDDEAFLVAVKRLGSLDALSREFAREHSERLWKQLVMGPGPEVAAGSDTRLEVMVVLGLACLAGLLIKIPNVFGYYFGDNTVFLPRHLSFFVLPPLSAYFVWKRKLDVRFWRWLVLPFVAGLLFANLYPFATNGATVVLTAMHLPIALWLVVGVAYAGARWRESDARMNFVRFSGELFIYYALIAFGGGVLTAITMGMFQAIGLKADWLAEYWIVPCGAMGALIVAAWLVEAKQAVIENMAPVLTRIFTPLFTAMLLAFLVTMAWTGSGIDVKRNVLIGFDLLLALVLGLLLYAASARDPQAPPGFFDILQIMLLCSALIVDVIALAALVARISEFGFSANKVAALGENVILLVNLGWSAHLYLAFLRGRGPYTSIERWQTAYLPVYAVWACLVVIVFPPLFGYL
jgi:hypothetical protein